MARTIGKVKIRKLKELVRKIHADRKAAGQYTNHDNIIDLVPDAWFDIWESGWAEIQRIIQDELSAITYGK